METEIRFYEKLEQFYHHIEELNFYSKEIFSHVLFYNDMPELKESGLNVS